MLNRTDYYWTQCTFEYNSSKTNKENTEHSCKALPRRRGSKFDLTVTNFIYLKMRKIN